jgi:hypothetical protein
MDDDSSFEDCTPVASDEDESIDCEDDTYMAGLEQDLMNHLFDAKNESTFILPCCEKKCLENAFHGYFVTLQSIQSKSLHI